MNRLELLDSIKKTEKEIDELDKCIDRLDDGEEKKTFMHRLGELKYQLFLQKDELKKWDMN
ncbi:MAG: hypothetical protein ACM3MK_12885 [Chitinophagales bacterium]